MSELSLEEKLEGARSMMHTAFMSAITFIRSEYGDEGVKKYFASLGRSWAEHWKKTPGEGALKAVNTARGLTQIAGVDINVIEESPEKVVFQITTCRPSKMGLPTGPGTPSCELCAAFFVEPAKALGWKATAKTGKIPCEWSITTT